MSKQRNTKYINPENLLLIARGEPERILKYLKQFLELVPDRIILLKKSLHDQDREKIRQILHQMSPQLQFFGVPNVVESIGLIEQEYQSLPFTNIISMVKSIVKTLDGACEEINQLIETNYFEIK